MKLFFQTISGAAGCGERFRQECCAWHGELSFICAHSGLFRPPISAAEAAKSIKKHQVHGYITEIAESCGKAFGRARAQARIVNYRDQL